MEAKDYLFQNPDGSWNFGRSKTSPCPAGGYRLDHVEGSETFTIRDRNNRDADVGGTDRSPNEFMDINSAPYANFAAFHTACKGFFFRKLAISEAEADEKYVQIADGEPVDIAAISVASLQSQFQNDILEMSGLNYDFPVGATNINANSGTMVDGTQYFQVYNIKKAKTITGVAFNMVTAQATFTADNFNGLVLYSVNKATGELTELTRTANDGNIWKGAINAKISVDFLVPQNVQPGLYAVGLIYNSSAQTTAVTLATCGTVYSSFHLFNNNIRITSLKAAQTDLPSSVNMSTLTVASTVWGILLR